jgi:hypothetical protein
MGASGKPKNGHKWARIVRDSARKPQIQPDLQIQDCAQKKGTVAFFSKLLAIASCRCLRSLPHLICISLKPKNGHKWVRNAREGARKPQIQPDLQIQDCAEKKREQSHFFQNYWR